MRLLQEILLRPGVRLPEIKLRQLAPNADIAGLCFDARLIVALGLLHISRELVQFCQRCRILCQHRGCLADGLGRLRRLLVGHQIVDQKYPRLGKVRASFHGLAISDFRFVNAAGLLQHLRQANLVSGIRGILRNVLLSQLQGLGNISFGNKAPPYDGI